MTDHKMSGMTKMLIEIAMKKEVKDYVVLSVFVKFSILGEHANTKTIWWRFHSSVFKDITLFSLANKYYTKRSHFVRL
jgi:hypothetical protein